MFQHFSINIWALLVSIISSMVLGMLWYSPLLWGNIWLKLVDRKAEDISKKESNAAMSLAFIPAVVSSSGLAFLVSMTGASSGFDAIVLGSLTSLAFSGMSSLNLVFFEDRSLKLTLLNVGYGFISYNAAALLLTLWR